MKRFRPMIAVVGASACGPRTAKLAFEAGRLAAGRGAIVICGGYGGVMEHAARGAKSAGGTTVGILSGKKKSEANRWIDIPVVTGLRHARNAVIALSADGMIAVSGAYGTLSEIAFAFCGELPVVGLGSWELRLPGQKKAAFVNYASPERAVSALFARLSK